MIDICLENSVSKQRSSFPAIVRLLAISTEKIKISLCRLLIIAKLNKVALCKTVTVLYPTGVMHFYQMKLHMYSGLLSH